jgi:hypothetical protein
MLAGVSVDASHNVRQDVLKSLIGFPADRLEEKLGVENIVQIYQKGIKELYADLQEKEIDFFAYQLKKGEEIQQTELDLFDSLLRRDKLTRALEVAEKTIEEEREKVAGLQEELVVEKRHIERLETHARNLRDDGHVWRAELDKARANLRDAEQRAEDAERRAEAQLQINVANQRLPALENRCEELRAKHIQLTKANVPKALGNLAAIPGAALAGAAAGSLLGPLGSLLGAVAGAAAGAFSNPIKIDEREILNIGVELQNLENEINQIKSHASS